MAVVADSGALYALYDASDAHLLSVRDVVENEPGAIIVPIAILAEVDYLHREYLGVSAELDFLDSLSSGAFTLEPFTQADLLRCRELIAKYRSLDLGVADAAIVSTAERLGIQRLLTLDERDFRAVRPKSGKPFVLLPADAES
jgi:hypothetical protein